MIIRHTCILYRFYVETCCLQTVLSVGPCVNPMVPSISAVSSANATCVVIDNSGVQEEYLLPGNMYT